MLGQIRDQLVFLRVREQCGDLASERSSFRDGDDARLCAIGVVVKPAT